jgi:glucose-fructose oxidoreductase
MKLSRRSFLKRTSGATLTLTAFPTLLPTRIVGRAAQPPPNSRIAVGCIGTGPQGRGVMGNFLTQEDCRVVALCDVKTDSLAHARNQVNQAYGDSDVKTCEDYRELIARPDIDCVLIATPDHWHVPIALAAAKAGKDMYVEKPLGLSIQEDQKLRKVIHSQKRKFQFGTQQRSGTQFWQACEWVLAGRIGTLKHIDVWCSASRPGGTTQPTTPPAEINYDRWLGPAPYSPYTAEKCVEDDRKTWWYTYDYALGFVAGWGVHPLDIAAWGCPALFEGPLQVEGKGIFPTDGACNTSVAWEVHFKAQNGVTLRYRGTPNGYNQPSPLTDFSDWRQHYGNIVDHGTAFVGTEGWILVDRTQLRTHPENLIEHRTPANQARLTRSPHHVQNLLDAIQTRGPTVCDIDTTFQADLLCHLSDLATRLDRPLTWNPKTEKFTRDAEANRRLRIRSTRKPYQF